MSHWKKFIVAAIASASAALLLPIAALAASYSDNMGGIEVYATNTHGVFTGTASGSLPGAWSVSVFHTPLAGYPEHAYITGGSFDVVSGLTVVSGSFNYYSGTVRQIAGLRGCTNQVYEVNGALTNVGQLGDSHIGTGNFFAHLTHYRTSIFGHCVIYGASISGTVSLNF